MRAIHTATDGTSPAHTDAKEDPKNWAGLGHPIDALEHKSAESDISKTQMNTAVDAARGVFEATYGNAMYEQAIKERE